MKSLPNKCVDLIFTSPPYAEQRKNQYDSISEKDYPEWTRLWMQEAKRIIKPNGNVIINIRTNQSKGQISKYVIYTRLKLWEDGWQEPEELIWTKPDSPPMGSIKRPRRAWEQLLWFSLDAPNAYCDIYANGNPSDRIGFENNKFEQGGKSHIHAGQSKAKQGTARCKDYVEVGTSKVDKSKFNYHPAQFPEDLSTWVVKMFCPEGGLVYDPFVGSGTTIVSCIKNNRNWIATDINKDYIDDIIVPRINKISEPNYRFKQI